MYKCPSCESRVSRDAYTCPACGHPLRESHGQQLAGCGCAVLGTIGGFVAFALSTSDKVSHAVIAAVIFVGIIMMIRRNDPDR